MSNLWPSFLDLMERGGAVMWPLLVLSLTGVTLAFERVWFWTKTNNPARVARIGHIMRLLRRGENSAASELIRDDRSVYGRVLNHLLSEGVSEDTLIEAVESQRPRMERFMAMLSTIITAAPLLGILGTVIGIIASFRVLGAQSAALDPGKVSEGIAEALLTTAAGLVVSLVVLFPYNAFRTQIDRTLGRIEVLAAVANRSARALSSENAPHDDREAH